MTEGAGKSIIGRCLTDEQLLQTDVLKELPTDRKPDDDWIGARLKVPHEFKTRLSARVQRKLKRTRKHGFYNPGDEVWMHFKPDEEELSHWRHQKYLKGKVDEDPPKESTESGDDDKKTTIESGDALAYTSQDNWLGTQPSLRAEN